MLNRRDAAKLSFCTRPDSVRRILSEEQHHLETAIARSRWPSRVFGTIATVQHEPIAEATDASRPRKSEAGDQKKLRYPNKSAFLC
jgi:hypothetical protein